MDNNIHTHRNMAPSERLRRLAVHSASADWLEQAREAFARRYAEESGLIEIDDCRNVYGEGNKS